LISLVRIANRYEHAPRIVRIAKPHCGRELAGSARRAVFISGPIDYDPVFSSAAIRVQFHRERQ
jgi:hypothetical protein